MYFIVIIATGLYSLTTVLGTQLITLYITASQPHDNKTLHGVYFYPVLQIRKSIIIQHHTESVRVRI